MAADKTEELRKARLLKLSTGLLPTFRRLHRDDPRTYPNELCPRFKGGPETTAHLWECPGLSEQAEQMSEAIRVAITVSLPKRITGPDGVVRTAMEVEGDVTRTETWITHPLSTGLSQQTDEARLWISRGMCPRTMLTTLRALNITEKRVP